MKKSLKVLAIVMAVILVLGVGTIAFAGTNAQNNYSGSCLNNFFTSTTASLSMGAHRGWDRNSSAYYSGGSSTDYTCRVYTTGGSPAQQVLFSGNQAQVSSDLFSAYYGSTGSFKFKVSNSHSPYRLYTNGVWGIYSYN